MWNYFRGIKGNKRGLDYGSHGRENLLWTVVRQTMKRASKRSNKQENQTTSKQTHTDRQTHTLIAGTNYLATKSTLRQVRTLEAPARLS